MTFDNSSSGYRFLQSSTIYPKFYWQDKENRTKIFAIGNIEQAASLPSPKMGELWISLLPFSSVQQKSFPWENWFLPSFYRPMFGVKERDGVKELFGHCPDFKDSCENKAFECMIEKEKETPSFDKYLASMDKALLHAPKIVLAKCTSYRLISSSSPWDILTNETASDFSTFTFVIEPKKGSFFIGFSPERLYQRTANNVLTESLAGTTFDNEILSSQKLRRDAKELREFSFVENFIEEQLKKISMQYRKKERQTIHAANLQHLYRAFEATLKKGVNDEEIISLLHPTPATSGFPRQEAMQFLEDHELFSRGLYAGAIGYLTAQESDLAVGLRSALVENGYLHTFTGGGIVKGSTAKKEWKELLEKEKSILKRLGACERKFGLTIPR